MHNLLYAQGGGMTAVINASAAGVIEAATASGRFDAVLAARRGIVGLLAESLVDCAGIDLTRLAATPGGVFGSCRFSLPPEAAQPALYDRLFDVLAAHQIGAFLYNGGNGSLEVTAQLSQAARRRGYPLVCVGVPKTIDNDIEGSDCCPGYGSAAKYLATSMMESGCDLAAMASHTTGRVFVMEVMGRNVGWLAAATALAAREADDVPHIVLVPEAPVDEGTLLARADAVISRLGYCAITVAEGIRHVDGSLVRASTKDPMGHIRLGGAGQVVAEWVGESLGCHHHYASPDYLQRAAHHWVSATDHAQALAVGRAAVAFALNGQDGVVAAIRRLRNDPYTWDIVAVDAAAVANLERRLPHEFLAADGLGISTAGRDYIAPLIVGELPIMTAGGLPVHYRLDRATLPRRLPLYRGWAEERINARGD
ncbi:pyrophosphate--fructose 6-phosphate 1-phosphotransferase [Betaproteobacteria bacterium]|nr:pyrophosphate--fructose 6-phosphate 1-phosphotransferase [Betaproteobacteria bacterium]GHU24691.1 pyrophosphate--fructose 6-phosphate 1-phosphotransferase [Betaproteobacteria bacterium]